MTPYNFIKFDEIPSEISWNYINMWRSNYVKLDQIKSNTFYIKFDQIVFRSIKFDNLWLIFGEYMKFHQIWWNCNQIIRVINFFIKFHRMLSINLLYSHFLGYIPRKKSVIKNMTRCNLIKSDQQTFIKLYPTWSNYIWSSFLMKFDKVWSDFIK